jgi:hypothetical protein
VESLLGFDQPTSRSQSWQIFLWSTKFLILAFLSSGLCLSDAAIAAPSGSPPGKKKVLQAEISEFSALDEDLQSELGIACRKEGRTLVIEKVEPASEAFKGGLEKGDVVLMSRRVGNEVDITINRDQNMYMAHLSCAKSSGLLEQEQPVTDGPTGNKQLALSTSNQHSALSSGTQRLALNANRNHPTRQMIAGCGMYYKETAASTGQDHPGYGFDLDMVRNQYLWTQEFLPLPGHSTALVWPWSDRYTNGHVFLNDFMHANWPPNLIGWHIYHLRVNKSGTVIKIWPMNWPKYNLWFSTNEPEFSRYSLAGIEALSKAHTFSIPEGSRLTFFDFDVTFGNFHDLRLGY